MVHIIVTLHKIYKKETLACKLPNKTFRSVSVAFPSSAWQALRPHCFHETQRPHGTPETIIGMREGPPSFSFRT